MKRRSLLSLFVFGILAAGHCEDGAGNPAAKPNPPSQAPAAKPRVDADGTLHLSAGLLTEVVAQIEQCLPELNKQGKSDWTMPNVIFDEDTATRDAAVPANLRLRQVSPVQALALAAAAAGCTLENIFAPDELQTSHPPAPPAAGVSTASLPVIGYRVVQSSNQTRNEDVIGIGISLVSKDGKTVVGEVYPGTPAARSNHITPGDTILSLAQRGSPEVPVEGLPAEKIAQLLRGPVGSVVYIKVRSEGKSTSISFPLVREKLKFAALNRSNPVQIINSSGGEVIGMASPKSNGPFLLLEGAEGAMSLVPASSAHGRPAVDPSGNLVTPPPDLAPFVRVYSTGSIFSGSEQESTEKQQAFINLVRQTLQVAGVKSAKPDPIEAMHEGSKALIVKGTATEHAIIQQIIAVLKENEAEATAGKPMKR